MLSGSLYYGLPLVQKRITETGGVDGLMGQGFYDALNEFVKKGILINLEDLYKKAV